MTPAAIEVENLSFRYPGAEGRAVDSLEFTIPAGEIFGLLGPNGAGKSTTQKILIGLLHDFEGRASVLGKELESWSSDLYERVGVAFEFPNHYRKLTGLENLAYFRSLYRGGTREPGELLERVGLAGDADTPVGQYSKGMQQRLSIARALLRSPELIFLDEPTAGLDPVSARAIKNLVLDERARGTTVFLTTHDMAVADQLCDRVALIVDSRVAVIDAPRDLKLRHGEKRVRLETATTDGSVGHEFPLEGLADNREFLELLRHSDVQTLHTLEATLEDVFIQVTGRRLR